MSDKKEERSALVEVADAALEVLATSWPMAETDDEIDAIVDGVDPGVIDDGR